ncbi:ArsR/SmtB family transcription factor [Cohnella sp.]|uniref:ArsR/SmtB family transcription factor n=1 Tax=Cohnella sp. TaxID=1883426 RepID=UPI003569A02A
MQLALQQFRVNFFKVMSHPLRLQILELICEGAKSVNELQSCLNGEGSMVSQQLSALRAKHLVSGIKEGNRVVYSIQNPLIHDLLIMTKEIFNNQIKHVIHVLEPQA